MSVCSGHELVNALYMLLISLILINVSFHVSGCCHCDGRKPYRRLRSCGLPRCLLLLLSHLLQVSCYVSILRSFTQPLNACRLREVGHQNYVYDTSLDLNMHVLDFTVEHTPHKKTFRGIVSTVLYHVQAIQALPMTGVENSNLGNLFCIINEERTQN